MTWPSGPFSPYPSLESKVAELESLVRELARTLEGAKQHMLDSEFDPECIAVMQIEVAVSRIPKELKP